MRAASGTLAMSRSGPGGDTRAYIWPRSWRKLETPTAPIRPGCAFDPRGDSRQPCVRSELEALPRLLGGHLFLYERIATSSTASNPLAASPELFPVHNQQRMPPIAEPSARQDPKAPIGVAQARPRMRPAQPTAAADEGFPRLAAPLA